MSMTKTDKVYIQLHEKIVKGVFRPGSRLVISQIAKEFNVSEIPVREVMQRLAQKGYVKLHPHAGPTVTSLTEDEVRQIFEIRANLESLATRLAVEHISNAHIKELELIIEDSIGICEEENFKGYFHINETFHNSLYRHSNNQMLVKMIKDITSLAARYPIYYQDKETMQKSLNDHKEILKAVSKRDGELAEQLTKKHLLEVIPKITEIVRSMDI
ncbi:GntR family transcriptional regulator [Neobacillus sp. SAB-20_R2A]|uniref:GntR family transcriptional regulator n=1 Tax=Neobacillus sp. SAB-20_R2A TaxID=3120519 RepID=UPI003C6DBC27